MAGLVPFTWDEMRARFEPTIPPEACAICARVPAQSYKDLPDVWKQLEHAGLPDENGTFVAYRCPSCHQLYAWAYNPNYNQYDPYNPDAAGEPFVSLNRMPAYEYFTGSIVHRVADDRFRRAVAALEPQLVPDADLRKFAQAGAKYWRRHQVVAISFGDHRRWFALSDDGEVSRCTLAELARIAAIDPPANLDRRDLARDYANLVDSATTEYQSSTDLYRFDDIRWRDELDDADRAYIEELRRASRVERETVEQLADRTIVTRWVVGDRRLICRVLTLWPTGVVQRDDAVIGEAIPVY